MTKRRLQALALSLELGQEEAAKRMGITHNSVKNHLQALYRELGVDTMSKAAISLGWLKIPGQGPRKKEMRTEKKTPPPVPFLRRLV